MPARRCLLVAVAVLLVAPAGAQAQLGKIVHSVGGAAPATGGLVGAASGAAGGLLAGVAPDVAAQLDQSLAGGPTRPSGPPPAGSGGNASGQGLQGGVLDFAVGSLLAAAPPIGSTIAVDGIPPRLRVYVISTLRRVHRTGTLKLLVRLDEAGIVALRGSLRPGARVRRARGGHSRALVRVPPTMLAFRRKGSLTVSVRLGRTVRRRLRRSRDARLQVFAIAVDAARNQAPLHRRLRVSR